MPAASKSVPCLHAYLANLACVQGFSTVSKGLWRGELVAVKQLLCGDRSPAKVQW